MATDTIRTQAQLLTYLTPGNNTVPAATALLAQTARDLVVTMFGLTRYSALAFGFVGDNATDNTAAWNTMMAALVNGDAVNFLPGRYKMDPALMVPVNKSISLFSNSPFAGVIFDFVPTTNTTADCLVISSINAALRNISLLASTPRTAGRMLNVTGASVIVDGSQMDNYFIGVEVSGASKNRLTNMRMQSTVAGCIDAKFSAGVDHYIDNFISNSASIPVGSIGVWVTGNGTNTVRGNVVFVGDRAIGLLAQAPAGQTIGIVNFSNSDFDTCTEPVVLQADAGGILYDFYLGHSWAGDTGVGGSHAVTMRGTGLIDNPMIDKCTMIGLESGKSAVKVTNASTSGLQVTGGKGQTINADVVSLPANIQDVQVQQLFGAAGTAGYGVGLPAGTSSRFNFSHNFFTFCTSGRINDGTGLGGSGLAGTLTAIILPNS